MPGYRSKPVPVEELALADPGVKFGFDNYDVLKQIGGVMREMREQGAMPQVALQEFSGIAKATSAASRLNRRSVAR